MVENDEKVGADTKVRVSQKVDSGEEN